MQINNGPFRVPGVKVGHWTHPGGRTGCTVVVCDRSMPASVDIRGGAPGTRETDLLRPGQTAQQVDAILLTGGSAFGLAAADGVMRALREENRGFPTAAIPVPLVSGAVVFDLDVEDPVWPDADAGFVASQGAQEEWSSGRFGAGRGASAGKFGGRDSATEAGIGVAQVPTPAGTVSALFVVNPFGDVMDDQTGQSLTSPQFETAEEALLSAATDARTGENTVIGVVHFDRPADHDGLVRIAIAAQSGISRVVRPAHTPVDGDTVFALASERAQLELPELMQICAGTQVAVARAVANGVR